MASGGFRAGSGRPKGVKNGERKQLQRKSAFKCEECFGCRYCGSPIGKKRKAGSGKCGNCASVASGRKNIRDSWTARACRNCDTQFSSAVMYYCSDGCRIKYGNDTAAAKKAAARPKSFAKTCSRCDSSFTIKFDNPRIKFCGEECRRATDNELKSVKRRAANDNHAPPVAVAYSVLRASGWKCAVCL